MNEKQTLVEKVACAILGREDNPGHVLLTDEWLAGEWSGALLTARKVIDMVGLEKPLSEEPLQAADRPFKLKCCWVCSGKLTVTAHRQFCAKGHPQPRNQAEYERYKAHREAGGWHEEDAAEQPWTQDEVEALARQSRVEGWGNVDADLAPYGHCTTCGTVRYRENPESTDYTNVEVYCISGHAQLPKKAAPKLEEPEPVAAVGDSVREFVEDMVSSARESLSEVNWTELGVMADRFLKGGWGGRKK